ncbi:MAG TPA: ABC transporter ATP-binding protein [Bacteroidia bacterium]|jgi:ABC-2 type transport system ATP-binding protein|nr:ABC transporter ATP-binding protein [Bacteroidia bacterium]
MIKVSHLKKKYGDATALEDVTFEIREGEFFGLLGPNGAGKTTTISILSTILLPDSGSVTIGEYDLLRNPAQCKRSIGVVTQEIALYNKLSAYDNLLFWGSLYDVPADELKKRISETLQLFGLEDRQHDKIESYSGGMKRRINIASALLHRPRILFMDEPTVGIDPQSRNLIFEVLEKLHKDGMTIIYTTHYMEEAERFCDRIGIIDKGKIIAQGSLAELRNIGGIKENIVVTFTSLPEELKKKISAALEGEFSFSENSLHYSTSLARTDLSKLILRCSEAGADIANIEIQKVNLETIFLSLTGKQLRD